MVPYLVVHIKQQLIASPSRSADRVATGVFGVLMELQKAMIDTQTFQHPMLIPLFSDYISESNSSLCAWKAINMTEGCLPVFNLSSSIHEENSNNTVLSSHRADAENSVANLSGTIPYSSPHKILLNNSFSINTDNVAAGNTQQDFTACIYCSYDDTNVSGIKLTL